MKGRHRAMLYALCLVAMMTTEAATSTTPETTNATTIAPTANVTTNVTTIATTANVTTNVTTIAPTENVTTNVTTIAPTANVTTNVTTIAPTENVTTIAPTENVTTIAPTANVTTKAPTTKKTDGKTPVSTTPVPMPHPSQYPSSQPNWGRTNLSIPLSIYVNGNFSQLNDTNSDMYKNYSAAFNKTLTDLYQSIPDFTGVEIKSFFQGSIGCNFIVILTPTASFNLTNVITSLRNVPYSTIKVQNNESLNVDTNKTDEAIEKATKKFETDPCSSFQGCSQDHDMVCVIHKETFVCSHKCNANNICSNNGECYVDTNGITRCRCREDSNYVYKGDTCKEKVLVFFSGRNTAIIGACAGAVIACLLLLFICIGARWRHKRTAKTPDEKLTDPEEIQRDNSKIENVPMDGVGKTNPMFRPDRDNRQQERHDDDYPGDRSDRGHVYEDEMAYNEGRYYRVLNDPESRSKAYVYQPSNMSMPAQRTSTASKFDELDSKPQSYHMRPEIEQPSYRDMVNTEEPYSIRRPQIMRSTVNSDGYR